MYQKLKRAHGLFMQISVTGKDIADMYVAMALLEQAMELALQQETKPDEKGEDECQP